MVFEVQENSDVTFRLYDWDHVDPKTGQRRPLQVDQAMRCIDFAQGAIDPVTPLVERSKPALREKLVQCEHFGVTRISGQLPFIVGAAEMPRVLVCLAGDGRAGATQVPATPSVEATSCSYRPWSERVPAGRTVSLACWKFRCRRLHDAMKKLIVFDLDGTLAESKSLHRCRDGERCSILFSGW